MFGSDASLGGFQGDISEAMFYVKTLNQQDIKECATAKKTGPQDKSIYQIRKEKNVFLKNTEHISKKKGIFEYEIVLK